MNDHFESIDQIREVSPETGSIYIETKAWLKPEYHDLYPKRIQTPSGRAFIRQGVNKKVDSLGRTLWFLLYSDKGELVSSQSVMDLLAIKDEAFYEVS